MTARQPLGRDAEIGGRRVPKGTLVLLDIYSMQRRPDSFLPASGVRP